jgi:transposase
MLLETLARARWRDPRTLMCEEIRFAFMSGPQANHPFDETAYRKRNFIERMFGGLKDWRRIATPATTGSQPTSPPPSCSRPSSSGGPD